MTSDQEPAKKKPRRPSTETDSDPYEILGARPRDDLKITLSKSLTVDDLPESKFEIKRRVKGK